MNHDKMMQAIHDIFDPGLPRLAPGDDRSTRRALEALFGPGLEGVGPGFRALDMGCGNGGQTLCLARTLGCRVTAVDNHQPYLDELMRRAEAQGVAELIEPRCVDMAAVRPDDEPYDLVWAEGSAFVLGVPEALRAWRELLKPGGALAFTELTWLEPDPPAACREFFATWSPDMADVAGHLAAIAAAGFAPVGHFTLPESSWWENFYDPLAARLDGYEPCDDSDEARTILDMAHDEIVNYRRYSRWFGYEFFQMRSRGR